ncbi:hypothetical protein S83_022775, partial [Arachis hypogaea]
KFFILYEGKKLGGQSCWKEKILLMVLERIRGFKGAIQRRANHTLSDSESVEDPTISQAAKEAPALSKEELDRLRGLMDSLKKNNEENNEDRFFGKQYHRRQREPVLVKHQLHSSESE